MSGHISNIKAALKKCNEETDSWGERLFMFATLPLLYLLISAFMGPTYDCISCGAELLGYADNCPECDFAFTEKGELRNVNKKLDEIQDSDRDV